MASSTTSQNSSGPGSGDGGGNRNRNRSRNNNRSRSRSGDGERSSRNSSSAPRSGGGGGGGRSRYTKEKVPRRAPKVSLWQKILGAVGLGEDAAKSKARATATSPLTRVGSTRVPSLDDAAEPRNSGTRTRRAERSSDGSAKSTPRTPRAPRPAKARRTPEVVEVSCERLYVGNLSYDAGEQELQELFSGVGNVRLAEVVSHKNTQRSKGYAFIEMGSIDEARRAVDELHDKDFMGRKLVVSGAKSVGRQSSDGDDSSEN